MILLVRNFDNVVKNVFNSYKNYNFYIFRDKPYNPSGRMQTEEESDALSKEFYNKLTKNYNILFDNEVKGNADKYDKITEFIIHELNVEKNETNRINKVMDRKIICV